MTMSKKKAAPVKPMLAGTVESVEQLTDMFPLIVSPKLDGVRALVIDNVVYSRNLKPIPNRHVQKMFGRAEFNGLDGELIVGSPTSPSVYRDTVSGVMSEDGEPNVFFYVFDRFDRGEQPYSECLDGLVKNVASWRSKSVVVLASSYVRSLKEFEDLEETWVNAGYEGIMLRDPIGKYKFGRASIRSRELLKFKRFEDAEAKIVGVEELFSNQNAATINALGHTERSSHKENQIPMDTLGALVVEGVNAPFRGVQFNIGSGFDQALRERLWKQHRKGELVGKIVKFKYFPIGILNKPRFPIFLGFRDPRDM